MVLMCLGQLKSPRLAEVSSSTEFTANHWDKIAA